MNECRSSHLIIAIDHPDMVSSSTGIIIPRGFDTIPQIDALPSRTNRENNMPLPEIEIGFGLDGDANNNMMSRI